jgi:hypothetical protein
MSRDASRDTPAPNPDERLRASVRQLVLLKETGPKSAAWHRARVRTIWRLHRALESAVRVDQPADPAHESSEQGGAADS